MTEKYIELHKRMIGNIRDVNVSCYFNTLRAVEVILGRTKFKRNCFPVVMYDSQGDVYNFSSKG